MNKVPNYELYQFHEEPKSCTFPDGIDQDSCTIGNAKDIIKWLLMFDLKGYKLAKKKKPNKK